MNEDKKVIESPIIIIHPKSITGRISEKTREKKATIVVNDV